MTFEVGGRRVGHAWLGAMGCLLFVLLAAGPALAQAEASKKQAQALQVEGLRLMQKGDNRGALDKFDQAFRLVASPKILFNRGKAHRALGEELEALTDFERFLDEAPYAPKESREEAKRTVETLRPKVSYLEIQIEDPGSTIIVDGREIGTAPLARPLAVVPGSHEIRVAKSGMNDDRRSVAPIPGQKLRVVIKLVSVPEAASAPPRPAPIVAATAVAQAPGPLPETAPTVVKGPSAQPSPDDGGRPWQIPAAWGAAGASVVFLGAGIALQVSSASKSVEFDNVANAPNTTGHCAGALPNRGGGPCQELYDAAHDRKVFAIVGYVAAGLAAAGSVVLFATAPSSTSRGRDVAAACIPSQTSGVACSLAIRF